MNRKVLFVIFLCYFEITFGMNSGLTSDKNCSSKDECIPLRDCKSFVHFVKSLEKPLKPSVVEFLRDKQCGFHQGYPKVCCLKNSKNDSVTLPSKNKYRICSKGTQCMPLKNCKSHVDFIKSIEKPLKPLVVQFLRSQQCGFRENYPMVCCSPVPKYLKTLKHARSDSRPHQYKKHNKLSIIDPDSEESFTKIETTTKTSRSNRDKKLKEKIDAINKQLDLADYFDLTGFI